MSLVQVGPGKITWYWEQLGKDKIDLFRKHLEEKRNLLMTSNSYLNQLGLGYWHLVLYPEVIEVPSFMPESPVDTFVGRGKDLEDLHKILQKRGKGAIAAIVGTGGIGKTELAKMYAKTYSHEYPDGVFWASLKGSNWKVEADKILSKFQSDDQHIIFEDDARAKEATKKALDHKCALLIIDNVDQGDQVIHPDCFLLITSRNKDTLGIIAHEAVYRLSQLPIRKGIDLIEAIIGSNRVRQDITGAERIVQILGGMPLAVQIAAKQLADVPGMTFPDYIRRVEGRISELVLEGYADKDVVASLEMSLEQLRNERDGQHLLSLFEAVAACDSYGFRVKTLAAAAGLLEKDDVALSRLVGKLHGRSLLEYDPVSGLYNAHTLLRQLAHEHLTKNPARLKLFRENHTLYFLDYAEKHRNDLAELITEREGLWFAMIQANQIGRSEELLPKFLAHLSAPYLALVEQSKYEDAFLYLARVKLLEISDIGQSRRLLDLLEILFREHKSLQDHTLGWLFMIMATSYAHLGDYRKAIQLYEKALEIHCRIGDLRAEAGALGSIGAAWGALGEYQKGISFLKGALRIHRTIGDVSGEGKDLINMGLAHASIDDYQKAIGIYESALEIHRRVGALNDEGSTLNNMGLVYHALGRYRKAIEFHEQALEIHRKLGDVKGEENALLNMSSTYQSLGDYQKAIELCGQALALARRIEDSHGEGNALGNMGLVYTHLGKYKEAIECHKQALAISRKIGDLKGEGTDLENLGVVCNFLGDYQKAIEFSERALQIHRRIGDLSGEGSALGTLGQSYDFLGDQQKAMGYYEQSLEIARKIGNVELEGKNLASIGSLYHSHGGYQKAIEFYKQALEIARKIGDVGVEGTVLINMGLTHASLGQYKTAIGFYEQGLDIARKVKDVSGEGTGLLNMSSAYHSIGEFQKAIELCEKSLEIARQIGDVRGEGNALNGMGLAYASLDQHRMAIDFYDQALRIYRNIGYMKGEARALGNKGLAFFSLGEHEKALELFDQSVEIHQKIGDEEGCGNDLGNMGLVYHTLGDYKRAIEFHGQHLSIARRIGDARGEGNALCNMGIAYAALGEKGEAFRYLDASKSKFMEMGLDNMVKKIESMMTS
jgi:tetratricopeptide (TPR) repeat protein